MTETNATGLTKRLKSVVVEQLTATDEYFSLMLEMERVLEDSRQNVSIAKLQRGYSGSNALLIDNREIPASFLVDIHGVDDNGSFDSDDGTGAEFRLVAAASAARVEESASPEKKGDTQLRQRRRKPSKDSDSKDDDEVDSVDSAEEEEDDDEPAEPKKTPLPPGYRPFGVLEPPAAKQARVNGRRALELACQLATLQSRVFALEEVFQQVNDEATASLGDLCKESMKLADASAGSATFEWLA